MPDGSRPSKLWAGRLGGRTSPVVERYTTSVGVDRRLHAEDIAGSRAHARMLHRVGLLDAGQLAAIDGGLTDIARELGDGSFAFGAADEDIHSAVERRLHELVGPVAGMLHTGRSRNDQVATDVRLYARSACTRLLERALALQAALIAQARDHVATVMPSYTHLQRAQPVSLAHHLLAYVEMLRRDIDRFLEARRRADVLPLGSGAVAGSTLPLDRDAVAAELALAAVSANSIDAVADRDFVADVIYACALTMVHCSRLGEEVVLWASSEFGFVALPDTHATGSSLMPQKKNPDVAELARARSARVIGDLVSLLTLLKGLPLAYNRDLQEDKDALFDAVDTCESTLQALTELAGVLQFDAEAMRRAASDPGLLATDVAEHLVGQGVPFREAHEIVGGMVRRALESGRTLRDISAAEWAAAGQGIDADAIAGLFDLDAALRRRETAGGPGPVAVARQLAAAEQVLHDTRAAVRASG